MLVNFAVPSLRLIFSSIFFTTALFLLWGINDRPSSPQSLQSLPKSGKNYAYTTFLAAPWNVNENATDDDDNYYTQTRMLNWQLRHDPPTRSPNNYPFVVLVTSEVSQSKRARMEREGMIVKEVKKLKLQHPTRKAWQDVLTKLRLFEMVEYDRLLFLDIDHVIARPMDGKETCYLVPVTRRVILY
jgi:alpha-N-acetylglucosamine transferase